MEGIQGETTSSPPGTRSTPSTKSGDSIKRNVQFVSGSTWTGESGRLGMCGAGVYKMPHGVTYEGTMNAGLFEGIGIMKYPNGGVLEGFWYAGKLKYCQYNYADGLKRETSVWPYCKMPDRRFYSELLRGLRPADTEQLTQDKSPRPIPPGHYDVGDGFYSPRTKCVVDFVTGETLRIPTAAEEKWILENCRKANVDTVGYQPELYKNWYETVQPEKGVSMEEEKEILKLILQDGQELNLSSRRDTHSSLQSKLDSPSIRELIKTSSGTVSADFELFLKNIIRELEGYRQNLSSRTCSGSDKSMTQQHEKADDDLVNFIKEITSVHSEKSRVNRSDSKLPKFSKMSISLISSLSNLQERGFSDVIMSISQQFVASEVDLSNDTGEFMGSEVQYRVDYNDYESGFCPAINSGNTLPNSK